jgi:hypothetical protein
MLLAMMSPEIVIERLTNGPANCLYVSDKEEDAKKAAKVYLVSGSLPKAQMEKLFDAYSTFMWRQGRNDNMEHDESV